MYECPVYPICVCYVFQDNLQISYTVILGRSELLGYTVMPYEYVYTTHSTHCIYFTMSMLCDWPLTMYTLTLRHVDTYMHVVVVYHTCTLTQTACEVYTQYSRWS